MNAIQSFPGAVPHEGGVGGGAPFGEGRGPYNGTAGRSETGEKEVRGKEQTRSRPGERERGVDNVGSWQNDTAPHHISHQSHAKMVGALGYTLAHRVSELLMHFHVPDREREHVFYPAFISWSTHGIKGAQIRIEDIDQGVTDLARKVKAGEDLGNRPLVDVLQGFVRSAAVNRMAIDERAFQRHAQPAYRAQPERIGSADIALRQPVPENFREMIERYTKCAAELRSLGRSPREMPEDYDQLPASYLDGGD